MEGLLEHTFPYLQLCLHLLARCQYNDLRLFRHTPWDDTPPVAASSRAGPGSLVGPRRSGYGAQHLPWERSMVRLRCWCQHSQLSSCFLSSS